MKGSDRLSGDGDGAELLPHDCLRLLACRNSQVMSPAPVSVSGVGINFEVPLYMYPWTHAQKDAHPPMGHLTHKKISPPFLVGTFGFRDERFWLGDSSVGGRGSGSEIRASGL